MRKAARATLLFIAALASPITPGQPTPAGLVNFYGEITAVLGSEFHVLTNPGADPQSAYKQEFKAIAFDRTTTFEGSAPEDLKISRRVQIVGREQMEGTIRAAKIVVYEGNAPVRQRKNLPARLPNGQTR